MNNMYVKKPISVRAIQWNGPDDNNLFADDKIIIYSQPSKSMDLNAPDDWFIRSIEADLRLTFGVWIVGPGARGEYWPVQDDIFKATYEVI